MAEGEDLDSLIRWINTTQAAQEVADLDQPHIVLTHCPDINYTHAVGPFANAFLALDHIEYLKSEWPDDEEVPQYRTMLLLPGLRAGETKDAI